MTGVPLPPWRDRWAFWVLGRRLAPDHRPWIAATLTAPGYRRRRLRAVLVLQTVFVVVPQLVLALTGGGRVHLLLAVFAVLAVALGTLLGSRLAGPGEVQRLLAHYGVTADGQVVEPVSFWRSSRVTPRTAGLLAVSIGVLVTGVVVVADAYVSPDRCRAADPAAVRAVEAVLDGGRLQSAQRVDTPLDGLSYLSAYVESGSDRVGPAVWRVTEPGGVFSVPELTVFAADGPAHVVSPTIGYAVGGEPDPLAERARECVRAAAD